MTLVITHQSYLQVQRLSWWPVIWPLDMTGEQQYLTLNNISQNPCHWYNINRPVISTGTMSVLMSCHMTSQVMSFTKFFTTDIAFEPVTLMFLLVTTNQEDNSWCLWPFWGLPDISTQNFGQGWKIWGFFSVLQPFWDRLRLAWSKKRCFLPHLIWFWMVCPHMVYQIRGHTECDTTFCTSIWSIQSKPHLRGR